MPWVFRFSDSGKLNKYEDKHKQMIDAVAVEFKDEGEFERLNRLNDASGNKEKDRQNIQEKAFVVFGFNDYQINDIDNIRDRI